MQQQAGVTQQQYLLQQQRAWHQQSSAFSPGDSHDVQQLHHPLFTVTVQHWGRVMGGVAAGFLLVPDWLSASTTAAPAEAAAEAERQLRASAQLAALDVQQTCHCCSTAVLVLMPWWPDQQQEHQPQCSCCHACAVRCCLPSCSKHGS